MKYFTALAFLLTICSCSQKSDAEQNDTETAPLTIETSEKKIKVFVAANGKIIADGKQTTLEKLDQDLIQLAKDSGVVYYSRANGQGDGPIESMQVIETVMKNGAAIKFYTDSTFTKAVDASGQPQ